MYTLTLLLPHNFLYFFHRLYHVVICSLLSTIQSYFFHSCSSARVESFGLKDRGNALQIPVPQIFVPIPTGCASLLVRDVEFMYICWTMYAWLHLHSASECCCFDHDDMKIYRLQDRRRICNICSREHKNTIRWHLFPHPFLPASPFF